MGNRDKVFSGLFWIFGERIFAQGISFAISIILARMLLPSEYGIIAIVLVFITFADVFVKSGFATALIQKKDATEEDFSTVFYCSLIVAFIIYIILFVCAPAISTFYKMPELIVVLRIFALRVPLGAYNSVQHAYVSRNMIFRKFFFATLGGTVVSGVIGIGMAYMGFGVWALVTQYLLNSIIDTIILNVTIRWKPQLLFSWRAARNLLGYGWKIWVSDLVGCLFDQLRPLIIGKFYTTNDLAYYNRGNSFASLATDNISTTITSVLFPALSNSSDDILGVKTMQRRALRVMSYVIFPMGVGLGIVSYPLVQVLLTEKWLGCVPFIQYSCISSCVGIIGSAELQSIKAVGRSDLVLKMEFIKKPIYLLALGIGVSISPLAMVKILTISSISSTLIHAVVLKYIIGYSLREQAEDLKSAFFLSVFMGIVVSAWKYIKLSSVALLIIQIISGVVIYLGMSILFKIDSYLYIMKYFKSKIYR